MLLPTLASLRVVLLLPQSGEFGCALFGAAVTAGLMPLRPCLRDPADHASMVAAPLLARLDARLVRSREPAPLPSAT